LQFFARCWSQRYANTVISFATSASRSHCERCFHVANVKVVHYFNDEVKSSPAVLSRAIISRERFLSNWSRLNVINIKKIVYSPQYWWIIKILVCIALKNRRVIRIHVTDEAFNCDSGNRRHKGLIARSGRDKVCPKVTRIDRDRVNRNIWFTA